jgi:hypothetical protein
MDLPSLPSLGMNLADYSYYTTNHPFTDVAKQSPWVAGYESTIELDSEGNLTEVSGTAIKNIFLVNDEKYPLGEYRIEWEGAGTVALASNGGTQTLTGSGAGWKTYNVSATSVSGLGLSVSSFDSGNPTRNVRILAPFTDTLSTDRFRKGYLDDLQGIGVLRFMDNNSTNNSPIANWSERTTLDHQSWETYGGSTTAWPYEIQVELCNELGCDYWICVPHLATDDYVEQLIALVESQLDEGLRIWVEYSNEVWNWQFTQAHYANDVLAPLYDLPNSYQAYGRRAGEIITIFKAASDRVVGIVAGQHASASVLTNALIGSTIDGVQMADVASIAFYWSADTDILWDGYDGGDLTAAKQDFFDSIVDTQESVYIPAAIANKAVADSYQMPLVSYEGGQHITHSAKPYADDTGFLEVIRDAQKDALMAYVYSQMLGAWRDSGGTTFSHFVDITKPSKHGCWGLKEFYDSPDTEAKFQAFHDFKDSIDPTIANEFLPVISSDPLTIAEGPTGRVAPLTQGRGPFLYEIVGGADAALFEGGEFIEPHSPLNASLPTDANNDGIYEVEVQATGWYGLGSPQALELEVSEVFDSTGWTGKDVFKLRNPIGAADNFFYILNAGLLSASFKAAMRSDGGDIRATKSDGTQLPVYLHNWIDGESNENIYIGYGSRTTADEHIWLFAGNASASQPDPEEPFGQFAVFPDTFKAIWADGAGDDITSNANHLTMTGSPTVGGAAGPIDGSRATAYTSGIVGKRDVITPSIDGTLTHLALCKSNDADGDRYITRLSTADFESRADLLLQSYTIRPYVSGSGGAGFIDGSSIDDGEWNYIAFTHSPTSRVTWLNGAADVPVNTSNTTTGMNKVTVGAFNTGSATWEGPLSLLAIADSVLSAAFHEHFYRMMDGENDPTQSGFYEALGWEVISEPVIGVGPRINGGLVRCT